MRSSLISFEWLSPLHEDDEQEEGKELRNNSEKKNKLLFCNMETCGVFRGALVIG